MNEEMRKEFELWWVDFCVKRHLICSLAKLVNGEYASINANTAWNGWQASREAMKPIKLPDFNVFIHSDCWFDGESEHVMEDFDVNECRNFLVEAIQQAGYKVAE